MSKMTSHATRAILATLLLGLCLQADAGTPAPAGSDHADARLRTVLAYELADIRSREDLALHLRRTRGHSPLDALSPASRERFLDSLVFNANGLAQYRFDDLQRELTVTQAYRILRLFGAGESAPFLHAMHPRDAVDAGIQSFMRIEDHEGGKCAGPGTCEMLYPHYICTSNC